MEVDNQEGVYYIRVSSPSPKSCRASRSMQHFLASMDAMSATAPSSGRHGDGVSGGYPRCRAVPGGIPLLDMPADLVDVNVHLAKIEVRFARENDIPGANMPSSWHWPVPAPANGISPLKKQNQRKIQDWKYLTENRRKSCKEKQLYGAFCHHSGAGGPRHPPVAARSGPGGSSKACNEGIRTCCAGKPTAATALLETDMRMLTS